ncbi:hypothetical protein [Candidatus Endowatersipora endosymbiont of Watersipora subatra]|uniref:hypothetical protein n=1 Tax=Candidatus Endowatersipora endosymbiont of Watersipora subatra TaxID=3077946 RepID=UPI00312C9F70
MTEELDPIIDHRIMKLSVHPLTESSSAYDEPELISMPLFELPVLDHSVPRKDDVDWHSSLMIDYVAEFQDCIPQNRTSLGYSYPLNKNNKDDDDNVFANNEFTISTLREIESENKKRYLNFSRFRWVSTKRILHIFSSLFFSISALLLFYNSFSLNEPLEVQTIIASSAPVKVKPKEVGGLLILNQDQRVYRDVDGTASETPRQTKLEDHTVLFN